MKKKTKDWIDNASYEELLRKWRFGTIGDPMFQGETGDYYKLVMVQKENQLEPYEKVQISKRVGWG